MSGRITRLRLPLLVKDLTEAAARRRTYVLRVVFLVVAGAFFLPIYQGLASMGSRNVTGVLGEGAEIAEFIFIAMLCAVYLLLPASMCGALTHEKESGTLPLLLITDLGGGEIILQKLLAGLVPLLTTFALLLPFAGLAYTLGGVNSATLLPAAMVVLAACLQVGAVALMASVWCRTTAGAFLFTCATLAILAFGTIPALMVADASDLLNPRDHMMLALTPLWPMARSGGPFGFRVGALLRLLPALGISILMLGLARGLLWRRASVERKRLTMRLFGWLDAFWGRLNRVTGDVVLIDDGCPLPVAHPVRWREIYRNSLTRTTHLLRLGFGVGVFVVPLCLFGMAIGSAGPVLPALWALMLGGPLFLVVKAAGLFAEERSAQRLDVLLTTPLGSEEIVREKMTALRRLYLVYLFPFAMAAGTFAILGGRGPYLWIFVMPRGPLMLVGLLVEATLYVWALLWFATWLGLRFRAHSRVVVFAIAFTLAWRFLLPILMHLIAGSDPDALMAMWIVLIFLHVVLYVTMKWHCLRYADRYLGRVSRDTLSPWGAHGMAEVTAPVDEERGGGKAC